MKFLLFLLIFSFSVACAREVKVLSYNVWFDDASGISSRYQQINDFISEQSADYVCLQEVTPAYLQMLKKTFSAQYQIYPDDRVRRYYGNVVLTKSTDTKPQIIQLKTAMNRRALMVVDRYYTLVNVHLESMLSDTEIREQQISQIKEKVDQVSNVIVCGDFNFGDGEPENQLISEFMDTGKAVGEVTYDVENNNLAKSNKFFFEASRRLDRILVKTQDKNFNFEVKKVLFSDHYPVILKMVDKHDHQR